MGRWSMSHGELRSFLDEKVCQWRRWEKQGKVDSVRQILGWADDEEALYLPNDASSLDVVEAILSAAEKSSTGIGGLREWLGNKPPLRRQLITLVEIVEALS